MRGISTLTPRELGLEFDSFRDVQSDVLAHLERQPEQFLAIEAPTGVGKSLIAVAHQRLTDKRVRILTPTLSLMQQYMRDFKDHAVTMRGRSNFPCVWEEADCVTAAGAPCTDGEDCPVMSVCPYYIQRDAATVHPLVVTSYAYYFAETMYASGTIGECDMLICDEAHRLRDILDELMQCVISHDEWEVIAPVPRNGTLKSWGEMAAAGMSYLSLNPQGDKKWRRKMQSLARRIMRAARSEEAHLVYERDSNHTIITPLWPKLTDVPIRAEQTVFMSGTLYGGEHFATMLGLPAHDYSFYSLTSPFHASRRPIYLETVVAMNSRATEEDYAKLSQHIQSIRSRHPNQKGVIHVNSNAQAAALYTALGRAEWLILHCGETGDARGRLFNQFRIAQPGHYLISPSAGEGEDFPDEQCRVNIIAKIPYPYLGDPLVSARMNDGPFGKKDYAAQAIMSTCQMIGRAMRSEEDYGFTYILDANVRRLLKYHRALWPTYILEAMI